MSQKYLCLGEFLKIKYLIQKILILADFADYISGILDTGDIYLVKFAGKPVHYDSIGRTVTISKKLITEKIKNGNLIAVKSVVEIFQKSRYFTTKFLLGGKVVRAVVRSRDLSVMKWFYNFWLEIGENNKANKRLLYWALVEKNTEIVDFVSGHLQIGEKVCVCKKVFMGYLTMNLDVSKRAYDYCKKIGMNRHLENINIRGRFPVIRRYRGAIEYLRQIKADWI
jgi:hypothetical protein